MLCKLAEAGVVTEELTWRPMGVSGVTQPSVQGPQLSTKNSSAANRPSVPNSAGHDVDTDALQRRIAELEAQRVGQVEQARQNGLDQGLRQGRQEAAAEMETALDRLARTIQDLAQVKRKVRGDAENELVKLSLAIARRVLHREITADPQSLRGVVYAALQQLQNREISRIRVFPAGIPAVRAALERNGGLSAIEIVPDGLLQAGGLLFETSLGELDASIETQLQEIERGFADKLQLR
jgi:flagellar assembly protein FliH